MNHKTVQKLMKESDLKCMMRTKKYCSYRRGVGKRVCPERGTVRTMRLCIYKALNYDNSDVIALEYVGNYFDNIYGYCMYCLSKRE